MTPKVDLQDGSVLLCGYNICELVLVIGQIQFPVAV